MNLIGTFDFRQSTGSRSGAAVIYCALSFWASLSGCSLYRDRHRTTVDELIQQALSKSDESRQIATLNAENRSFTQVEFAPVGSGSSTNSQYHGQLHDQSLNAEPLRRVTEDFTETDVREALMILAESGEVELIMDEKVNGVANVKIDDMEVDKAIEMVLLPLGLVSARHGNRFVIAPADPTSPLFPYIAEVTEYRPQHLEAKVLLDAVPEGMKKFVKSIEGTSMIMIEAPAVIRQQIVDRFNAIDQPVPQVILEAIICVVAPDSASQLGLDWQHAVELNGATALKLGANGLALNGTFSQPGISNVFSDFATTSAFVKLLSENGYLTIRAAPHVMAKDGERANITINRESFFTMQPIQSDSNGNSSSFFFQQNVQKVESGIALDIVPKIRGDLVTIQIEKAEVSEDIRTVNSEAALNPFPIINRRSVSTTVHVKDGKTIVIGGLVQRETVDRSNRVPGLSRIPLMGYLFESKQRQTREADVVIFISPRIVQPSVCNSETM